MAVRDKQYIKKLKKLKGLELRYQGNVEMLYKLKLKAIKLRRKCNAN